MKASLQLQPMYCSRDYNYSSRLNQQYEKPTQDFHSFVDVIYTTITPKQNKTKQDCPNVYARPIASPKCYKIL